MATNTIAAVKYACNGEAVKAFATGPSKVYNLKPDHPIHQEGEGCPVSVLIDMPLLVLRLRPSLLTLYRPAHSRHRCINNEYRKQEIVPSLGELRDRDMAGYANYSRKDDDNYFPNDTAGRLMVNCSDSEGITPLLHPPQEWIHKVGSVLVARQDKVPLYEMHVEILEDFISAIHKNFAEGGQLITVDAIKEIATPQMWRHYWKMTTDEMLKTAEGSRLLEGVPPPFEEKEEAPSPVVEHEKGGGVQLDDSDMMDFSDVGFVQ